MLGAFVAPQNANSRELTSAGVRLCDDVANKCIYVTGRLKTPSVCKRSRPFSNGLDGLVRLQTA